MIIWMIRVLLVFALIAWSGILWGLIFYFFGFELTLWIVKKLKEVLVRDFEHNMLEIETHNKPTNRS